MFEESTICQMYLLNCIFQNVYVFKPASSKCGNSEVYVICLRYKGKEILRNAWNSLMGPYKSPESTLSLSMFSLDQIDGSFIQQIISCSNYFMNLQVAAINDNVKHFKNPDNSDSDLVICRKICVVNYYIEKYNVRSIQKFKRISQKLDALNYVALYYRLRNCYNWPNDRDDIVWLTEPNNTALEQLLTFKEGKSIERLQHSYFCSKTCLTDFSEIENAIEVINLYLCNLQFSVLKLGDYVKWERHDEFQQAVFEDIRTKINDNVAFLKLPFLTSFLIAVLYILSHAYSCVVAHKSGILIFRGFKPECFEQIKHCFNEISDKCKNIKNCAEFQNGIIEVIPLCLIPDTFVNMIWHYNNIVCGQQS